MPQPTLNDVSKPTLLKDSLLRTIIPRLAGLVIVGLLKLGIEIDTVTATLIVTEVVSWIYYTVVRALEVFRSSKWGILLGKVGQPIYPNAIDTTSR